MGRIESYMGLEIFKKKKWKLNISVGDVSLHTSLEKREFKNKDLEKKKAFKPTKKILSRFLDDRIKKVLTTKD